MRGLPRPLRILMGLGLLCTFIAFGAAPLQRYAQANDTTPVTVIATVLVGLSILFFGAKVLRLVWRVLRWLFKRRQKAQPAAPAKPVAPPVVQPALKPKRHKVDTTLPASLAEYLKCSSS